MREGGRRREKGCGEKEEKGDSYEYLAAHIENSMSNLDCHADIALHFYSMSWYKSTCRLERNQEREQGVSNLEYLKNVVLKVFVYHSLGGVFEWF